MWLTEGRLCGITKEPKRTGAYGYINEPACVCLQMQEVKTFQEKD